VLLLGAAGPEFKISELGSMVGEAFTASLDKQAQGFEVISRQTLLQNLQSTDLDESMADTDAMADVLCSRLHAKALVLVKLDQLEKDSATASVYLFDVHESPSKSIVGWRFQIPLDDALRQASADLLPKGQEPIPDGVKPPVCVVCPRPDYSSEARSKKLQGTVLLSVLVGADGKATDIRITKGASWGINGKAIEAVKAWKFKPATGPDGKPVAQRITLEIVFQLLP
jgi:TonB family protein